MEENSNVYSKELFRPQGVIDRDYRNAEKRLQSILVTKTPNPGKGPANSDVLNMSIRNNFFNKAKKQSSIIQKENLRLSCNLQKIRSSLSVKKWTNDYQKTRKYMKIASKPAGLCKTLRPTSRQDPRRPLIDNLNNYLLHL